WPGFRRGRSRRPPSVRGTRVASVGSCGGPPVAAVAWGDRGLRRNAGRGAEAARAEGTRGWHTRALALPKGSPMGRAVARGRHRLVGRVTGSEACPSWVGSAGTVKTRGSGVDFRTVRDSPAPTVERGPVGRVQDVRPVACEGREPTVSKSRPAPLAGRSGPWNSFDAGAASLLRGAR